MQPAINLDRRHADASPLPTAAISSPGFSRGFEKFALACKNYRDMRPNGRTLEYYVEGPEFFGALLDPRNPEAAAARRLIYGKNRELPIHEFSSRVRGEFARYVLGLYPTLDDVKPNVPLAAAVGLGYERTFKLRGVEKKAWYVPPRATVLAERLFELGIYSPIMPTDQPICRADQRSVSFYLRAEFIGEEAFERNLRYMVRRHYKNLDDVTVRNDSTALHGLLGFKQRPHVEDLAAAIVRKEYLSPIFPPKHEPPQARQSFYFNPEIVGAIQAKQNVAIYMRSFSGLDEVAETATYALGSSLGLPKRSGSVREVLATLIKQGHISPEIPEGYSAARGSGEPSYYFNAAVVGEEMRARNIELFARRSFPTLALYHRDTPGLKVLGVALGVGDRPLELAKIAVKNKWVSTDIPADEPLTKGSLPSNYLNVDVVGKTRVRMNLRSWVNTNYPDLSKLPHTRGLASIMASIDNTVTREQLDDPAVYYGKFALLSVKRRAA